MPATYANFYHLSKALTKKFSLSFGQKNYFMIPAGDSSKVLKLVFLMAAIVLS